MKKNARKIRERFLQQKIKEQVSCIDEEDCESYIQRVKKIEEMQMKHKIIKARVIEDRVALTCVEMLDGSMQMGKGMTMALVEWNRQHFQQPSSNYSSPHGRYLHISDMLRKLKGET